MPYSSQKIQLPKTSYTFSIRIYYLNLKTISTLLLFLSSTNFSDSYTSRATTPTSLIILTALTSAAHRPLPSLNQGTTNRKFVDGIVGGGGSGSSKKFVAQPAEIDNEDEAFDHREFVRNSGRGHDIMNKYEKRVFSKFLNLSKVDNCEKMKDAKDPRQPTRLLACVFGVSIAYFTLAKNL